MCVRAILDSSPIQFSLALSFSSLFLCVSLSSSRSLCDCVNTYAALLMCRWRVCSGERYSSCFSWPVMFLQFIQMILNPRPLLSNRKWEARKPIRNPYSGGTLPLIASVMLWVHGFRTSCTYIERALAFLRPTVLCALIVLFRVLTPRSLVPSRSFKSDFKQYGFFTSVVLFTCILEVKVKR